MAVSEKSNPTILEEGTMQNFKRKIPYALTLTLALVAASTLVWVGVD